MNELARLDDWITTDPRYEEFHRCKECNDLFTYDNMDDDDLCMWCYDALHETE